ncbi:hypothetical protein GCM10007167_22940 [Vulcaniibacterium thermophilum]|uniref:Uncharacterized protein n=2 Tax=Vulcaniibacterium thermophilum TaxID=1169913 RepID=A0A919DG51_9GAMM|nr:hypothetical protein GCM10007167_22940 [Vulcaniibacterium thermophilum]
MTASRRSRYGSALMAVSLALTGCSAAMSSTAATSPTAREPDDGVEWPLKFKAHYFDAYCFSTYGCKVHYRGRLRVDHPDDELQPSSEALGDKYPDILDAGMGPIPNFPPPAKVSWRAKDGTPLEAEVDIGEIFRDELIRHHVAREDATPNATSGAPGIILEVNDRTINVYMRAMIWLKQPRDPERPHSNYRDDIIKVFSRTY